ncbi:uncharacterized protein BJX67DRAFT_219388 [Aspergillus lucknowensis]|uniref:Uncharacterized protein n=1 Tax=Aspergillus lucknowensis TaxID=176173 RepID=A0ABR4M3U1_9EURO
MSDSRDNWSKRKSTDPSPTGSRRARSRNGPSLRRISFVSHWSQFSLPRHKPVALCMTCTIPIVWRGPMHCLRADCMGHTQASAREVRGKLNSEQSS